MERTNLKASLADSLEEPSSLNADQRMERANLKASLADLVKKEQQMKIQKLKI